MGDEATHLDCIEETIGGGLSPGGEGLLCGQAIEGVIELYGGEVSGVKVQPPCFGQLLRVKSPRQCS